MSHGSGPAAAEAWQRLGLWYLWVYDALLGLFDPADSA